MTHKLIGCDIGGVVKDMTSNAPIEGALESLRSLQKLGFQIVFISKCKTSFRSVIKEWLLDQGLDKLPIHFCEEYADKAILVKRLGLHYMIDDKLQVFKDIPDNIMKLWLCNDDRKIDGARQFQSSQIDRVHVCRSWSELCSVLGGVPPVPK